MKTISTLLFGIAVIASHFAFPTSAFAADWPEFRGPTHDGHSDAVGLPVTWSRVKNVAWRTELRGKAWSSPVVADGRIYLTNAVASRNEADPHDARSLRVMALDAAKGKVLWDQEVFSIHDPQSFGTHRKNSFASPTPVVEGGRIYAHFGHLGTACLDTSGRVIWKSRELAYKPVHGNGGCPVVADDLLIFNCDGEEKPFIAALEKGSGQIRWQVPRETDAKKTFSFCTPLLIEVDGKQQLISPGSNMVCALNPADGSEIWRVRYEGYSVVPRPVFGHNLVYMSTGFDHPVALAIRPDGSGDVTETHVAWRIDKHAPHTPSMLLSGDDFFMVSDNGIVTCADAKTGAVIWQERVAGPCSASPLLAEGRIYITEEKGITHVIRAARKFEHLETNDLQEETLASHAVSGNRLLIRTKGALYCIGNR